MKIKDLDFVPFINQSKIQEQIKELARQISTDYAGKTPVFLPILNGSFMFASDLIKQVDLPCRVCFVKVSSYSGTNSSGQLKTLVGIDESLFNQEIIIIEDIIDSGLTLKKIIDELTSLGAKSVQIVTLLRKQPAREKNIQARYVGFDIDDEFVLGYGLDYDGLGRNYTDLYKANF
jgi:hypoxanthine phosphoribosyltransferase